MVKERWMNEWIFNDTPAQNKIGYCVSNKWNLHKNLNGKYRYIKNSDAYNTV